MVDAERQADIWSVYVDGSSAQEGAGTGILLIGLDQEEFKYFVKFTSPLLIMRRNMKLC